MSVASEHGFDKDILERMFVNRLIGLLNEVRLDGGDQEMDLPDSATMQRSLPSLMFLTAAIALAIAAGNWWLQYEAFSPAATTDKAAAILSDPEIRREINSIAVTATAPLLGADAATLGRFVEDRVLSTRAGAEMMAETIEEAHLKIIGRRAPLVRLTGHEMAQIVRDDRAAVAATVTLPVQPIPTLSITRVGLRWGALLATAVGAIALLVALITRPTRRDLVRGLAEFLIATAVSAVFFGYLLPVWLIPSIDPQTWSHAISALARRHQLPIILGALVLAGIGVVLIVSRTGEVRRRSTTLSASRSNAGSWS